MRILIVNRLLGSKGGVETYIRKLGSALENVGHDVQYFGVDNEGRVLGNRFNIYLSAEDKGFMSDFYSKACRKKIRMLLETFEPEVVHLNNFHYQITPSIICEIGKWRKETKRNCKIVFTAHDFHLLCPNHMFYDSQKGCICEKCLVGNFFSCLSTSCMNCSWNKKIVYAAWMTYWRKINRAFDQIDTIVCCSEFIKRKYDTVRSFKNKTVALHNFIDNNEIFRVEKDNYILYFGRYKVEKGIRTLLRAAEELPNIRFIFAGEGPLANEIENRPNVKNVGFQSGDNLKNLIAKAKLTILPSELYENCPFSVIESQMYSTPVIGANIGGIPELISIGKTGEVFESGNVRALVDCIHRFWYNPQMMDEYSLNCGEIKFDTLDEYTDKLVKIYKGM